MKLAIYFDYNRRIQGLQETKSVGLDRKMTLALEEIKKKEEARSKKESSINTSEIERNCDQDKDLNACSSLDINNFVFNSINMGLEDMQNQIRGRLKSSETNNLELTGKKCPKGTH